MRILENPDLNPGIKLTPYQQKLVESVMPMCYSESWKMLHKAARYNPTVDKEESIHDLAANAMMYVCLAASRFDPGRGLKFTTYASFYIRIGIQKAMSTVHRVGPQFAYDGDKADNKPVHVIDTQAAELMKDVAIEDEPPSELAPHIVEAVMRLSLHQRTVFLLWIGGATMKEIGDGMGYSKTRAGQVFRSAILTLRSLLDVSPEMVQVRKLRHTQPAKRKPCISKMLGTKAKPDVSGADGRMYSARSENPQARQDGNALHPVP